MYQQLENFKKQLNDKSQQESEENEKIKNNYEMKLSELYNMNGDLADKNTILNENVKKINQELTTFKVDTSKSEEIQILQNHLTALRSEYQSLEINLNEKKNLYNKHKES